MTYGFLVSSGRNGTSNIVIGVEHDVLLSTDVAEKTISVNGVEAQFEYATTYSSVNTPVGIFCFATSVNDVIQPKGYEDTKYRRWRCPGKLHFFRIFSDGVLVRDMIPVRSNGVGYMYDKVSGMLFGNQGEGQFVIGPDV